MRMKKILLLLALIAPTLLIGCGKNNAVTSQTQSLQTTWIIDEVGSDCPTGHHEFTDKVAYCNALLDQSLYGGCAMPQRLGRHVLDCGITN